MRILSKTILAATLALAGFGQAGSALAAGGYTVVNTHKSSPIKQVWSANAGDSADAWRAANMRYAIQPGTASEFTSGAGVCFLDIKVEFADGYVQTFGNVNVCRGDRVIAS